MTRLRKRGETEVERGKQVRVGGGHGLVEVDKGAARLRGTPH